MCAQRVAITAGTAASLPSAFPHLAALQLAHCELHTAALLTALRGCQHLSSVVLEEPVHSGSTGLLAAAAPHWQAAVQRSISSREETSTPIARPGGRLTKSVATGLLLSRLPSLSCVTLSMGKSHRVLQGLAACVGGAAGRLQRLAISDTTVVRAETMDHYFLPALRACTSLKGLELGFEVPRSRFPDLARCPGLRGLRSLHIRKQVLDLRELDALLGGLPGGSGAGTELWMGGVRRECRTPFLVSLSCELPAGARNMYMWAALPVFVPFLRFSPSR